MDITKPSTSLWLVYQYEQQYRGEICEYELHPDWKSFPLIECPFDMALVAEDIGDWKEDNGDCRYKHLGDKMVYDAIRRTACRVEPRFTKPKLDDLLQAIEDGWAGHEGSQTK